MNNNPGSARTALARGARQQLAPSRQSSFHETQLARTAFFLCLVWPVYLTIGLGPVNITPARVAAVVAMSGLISSLLANKQRLRQYRNVLRANRLMISLFVMFIAWRLFANIASLDPEGSYLMTILDIASSGFFILILISPAMISTVSIVEIVLWGDFVLIGIGLIELITQSSVAPLLVPFSSGSMDKVAGYSTDVFRGDFFRVRSLSSHPILFGCYVAAAAPILIYLRVHGRHFYIRVASLVLIMLSPLMLVASGSRSVLIAAVIAISSYYLLSLVRVGRRNPMFFIVVLFGFTTLIVGVLATTVANENITSVSQLIAGRDAREESSSNSRLEMFDRGINALNLRPITGYGDGQAIEVAGLMNPVTKLRTIDSYYLVIAVNFGYIGLAIDGLFLLTILVSGVLAATAKNASGDQDAIAALCSASISVLICAITVTSSEYFIIIYALGAASAVAIARPRRAPDGCANGTAPMARIRN